MIYDQDFIAELNMLSLVIDLANYKENLTQNDKDDIMNRLDQQTKDILTEVQSALEEQNKMLEEQNKMLREILNALNNI